MNNKHSHILTIVIVLFGLLPAGMHADESGSYQNFGSTIDNASNGASDSTSFSTQDGSTTWRATTTESTSFQTGGSGDTGTESEEESEAGGSEGSGGGGSTGETDLPSGGHRGQGTTAQRPAPDGVTDAPSPGAAPVARERPLHPAASVVSIPPQEKAPKQKNSVTQAAVQPETQGTDNLSSPDRPTAEAPVIVMEEATRPTIAMQKNCFGLGALACLSAGQVTIGARLAWTSRVTSLYEIIPAYASGESVAAGAFGALRPGAVQIGTLVPFFGWRKKKKPKLNRV